MLTVSGNAGDNGTIKDDWYQLNDDAWAPATRPGGSTNWTADVLFANAGTNTIRAFALDAAGNHSLTGSVSCIYVVTDVLHVATVGKGSISPNYSNAVLEINRSYTVTATPGAGFAFTNWTGQVDGTTVLSTNKPALTFTMQSNLWLTATFVDTNRPVIKMTAPLAGQRVSNAVFTARGTATDNGTLSEVWYRLNTDGWSLATRAPGSTNWTADLLFTTAGTNAIQAFAVDAAGNHSLTSSVSLFYVVTDVLHVTTVGKGSISPNYSNAVLEINRSYTVTATPGTGYAFTDWTGRIGGTPVLSTNKPALTFTMQSNLVLTATFVDTNRPVVVITSPVASAKLTNGTITARGTATDNDRVVQVFAKLNDDGWEPVTGTTNWQINLDLESGPNVLSVYAVDATGNISKTNTVTFTCLKDLLITYWPMNDGDWKTFTGPAGDVSLSFYGMWGDPDSYLMELDMAGELVESDYSYSSDHRQLLLTGGAYGWLNFSIVPPLVELDEALLLNGGSRTSSSVIEVSGETIPVTLTVKVTAAGTVTVPAGTYLDCKQASFTLKGTVPGQGTVTLSMESYVLAPRVGMIKVGAYQASGTSFTFLGWEVLTAGSVNGESLRPSESARLAAELIAPPSDPPVLQWAHRPDGTLTLRLTGNAGASYVVETSPSLDNPEWSPFWTGTLDGDAVEIPVRLDGAAGFYRVRQE